MRQPFFIPLRLDGISENVAEAEEFFKSDN